MFLTCSFFVILVFMRSFLLNIYNKIENNKFKILFLTLFFVFIVFMRSFLEIILSSWYYNDFFTLKNIFNRVGFLLLHWLFWYFSAFLIVFIIFKYFLKAEMDKIVYLSISSLIILLPMAYAVILNNKIDLSYLDFSNVNNSIKNILTLFYFDSKNYVFFPEMVFILLGGFVFSFLYSKKIIKSIINTLISYLSIGLFIGFVYICSASFCLINTYSNILDSYFVFYWICFSFVLLFVLLFKEIILFFKNNKFLNKTNLIIYFLSTFFVLMSVIFKSIYLIDWFLVCFSYSILYFIFIFIIKYIKNSQYFRLITFFIVYGIFIFLSLVLFYLRFYIFNNIF